MISAVILTKDSQRSIERCIKSVQWCDEMVIIDDYSTDGTVESIKNQLSRNKNGKIKIYSRKLNNDFAQQRNFGLEKAKGDWVLFVDSDEVVSENLKVEIMQLSQNSTAAINCDGYFVKREDYFLGKWLKHGETAHIKLLRVAKKGYGSWQRKVHEIWQIKGSLAELKNPLLHYPHPTIKDFLRDINYYSTLHAQVAYQEGERTNYLKILLKPKMKFLQNYIFYLGFLDGMQGIILALMMSFHSFLTQGKLWQLQQSQKKSV